jgi:hypothetical protein
MLISYQDLNGGEPAFWPGADQQVQQSAEGGGRRLHGRDLPEPQCVSSHFSLLVK